MRLRPKPKLQGLAVLGALILPATANHICGAESNDLIPDGCTSYGLLENLNQAIRPTITDITRNTDYFSYYRLDLFGKECPFWDDNEGMCANIACTVTTINDEEQIPEIWRAEELGKLEGPKARHPRGADAKEEPSPLQGALGEDTEESCIVEADECDERDYCIPEDESSGSNGDYVSLIQNPERFTGYAGAGAGNVWASIYRENCFSKAQDGATNQAEQSFINILQDKAAHKLHGNPQGQPTLASVEVDDECLEKRVFYRVISGMHSSISMHLCWDHFDQTSGEWYHDLDCFVNRFVNFPERLQNMYFNYALLLRAVSKLRNYLPTYTFCSGDPTQNRLTKSKLLNLASRIPEGRAIFDEGIMFQSDDVALKEDFRNRFRNVSRIMDCVGCDKCRLWGKVQTQGYGTALKVLFEFDETKEPRENPPLRRTELVALINTLDRVSHSLVALQSFQIMWEERNKKEETARKAALPKEKKFRLADQSIWFQIKHEWVLVWKMAFWVMRSWIMMPKVLWMLAVQQIADLWNMAVGREGQLGERLYFWKGQEPGAGENAGPDLRTEL